MNDRRDFTKRCPLCGDLIVNKRCRDTEECGYIDVVPATRFTEVEKPSERSGFVPPSRWRPPPTS